MNLKRYIGECCCNKDLKDLGENVTKVFQQLGDVKLQLDSLAHKDDDKVKNIDAIAKFLRSGIYKASNAIKKDELQEFIEANEETIEKEYESVPNGQYYKWNIGKKPENDQSKHRANIYKAYDHSRVVLTTFSDDKGSSDYIMANYVDGYDLPRKFIATQGPLPSTVNDFWRMVVDTNAGIIVTLTKLVEKNVTKCEKYWADEGEKMFGDISVTT
ncbi:Tyrosine-protein phosphatase Lar-like protein, partial [Leptotrombidium deliense]